MLTNYSDTIKTWLALGDSYTIGESVLETDRYPIQTTKLLNEAGVECAKPEIIATTGWTTKDLLNAIQSKSEKTAYSIVSLLIGVNNQYQGLSLDEYRKEFTILLKRSIEFTGNNASHVFVISIPDYSVTPFARQMNRSKIAGEIDAFNAANKEIAEQFKVVYINITDLSRKAATDTGLVAADGLHFSGKAYLEWSRLLAPAIEHTFK